ncbi:MAG TPA: hypothetical protein VGL39_01485 [Jatrophihabitantaceae bacterium]
MSLFQGAGLVGYAGRPWTQPSTEIDSFGAKLPFLSDRMFGCIRTEVPIGSHLFCAKTWNGAQPPDMPTAWTLGAADADAWMYLNHHGGPVANTTARTIATPIPSFASPDSLIVTLCDAERL